MTVEGGRARSSRLPRTARRAQLLGAAGDVFVQQGYHAAAMDDIAEAAGVSKPVLYQHFGGKYELYLAVVVEHSAQLVQAVRASIASTTDNRQRVAATIAAYFELVEAQSQSFRLIFESDLTSDERVRELVDDVEQQCAAVIAEVIQQDTHLPADEAALLGIGLGGIAGATARWWLRGGRAMPIQDAVRLVTQLSWGGIREFPLWVADDAQRAPNPTLRDSGTPSST